MVNILLFYSIVLLNDTVFLRYYRLKASYCLLFFLRHFYLYHLTNVGRFAEHYPVCLVVQVILHFQTSTVAWTIPFGSVKKPLIVS